jgi:hypothetical protein
MLNKQYPKADVYQLKRLFIEILIFDRYLSLGLKTKV